MTDTATYNIELVFVGVAGHLPRFKVTDSNGKYVPGGLFRTMQEAEAFITSLVTASQGEEV